MSKRVPRPATTPGRHPGGRTCTATLLGLLSAPWLLDVLLAGSRAVA